MSVVFRAMIRIRAKKEDNSAAHLESSNAAPVRKTGLDVCSHHTLVFV